MPNGEGVHDLFPNFALRAASGAVVIRVGLNSSKSMPACWSRLPNSRRPCAANGVSGRDGIVAEVWLLAPEVHVCSRVRPFGITCV